MRFLYLILFFSLKYAFRIYFRRTAVHNAPKEYLGRTIYVSNHAASFMDPLVVASLRNPIVFFMTRADIFTTAMKPILWASHMLPIYRQHDGEDTKKKNDEVFDRCAKVLNFGRNLLIFGEGFTDDVFIRRLKPVKKGAVRIGFYALEKSNWKKKIYLAAVGANYTKPNLMRSDCLVSTSDKICLNDYRKEYELNPNKVVTDLTKEIENRMQQQITHVENADDAPFHEAVQQITRQGMHPTSVDRRISLEKRWRNSQKLAYFFNANKERIASEFQNLRARLFQYNADLSTKKMEDRDVIEYIEKGKFSRTNNLLRMLALSPFALLGFIHCWPIYVIVKKFVEKSFKRKVFYGSVKLLLGMIGFGLINIPVVFLFYYFVYPSWWLAIFYYSLIGLFFLAMIMFNGAWFIWKRKGKIKENELKKMAEERLVLQELIQQSDLNITA
jgi:Acyltransferase